MADLSPGVGCRPKKKKRRGPDLRLHHRSIDGAVGCDKLRHPWIGPSGFFAASSSLISIPSPGLSLP